MRVTIALAAVMGGLLALVGGAASAAPDDMSIGPTDAKVTVIEYASTTCPHCARWDLEVFPAFKRKYVDTGKVHFVMRELPTDPADLAVAGFLLARCAGPRYFDTLDALWSGQEQLFKSHDAKAWLLDAGKSVGFDEAKVKSCLDDQAAVDAFRKREEANLKAFAVTGTPTLFVNGEKIGQGEIPLETVEKAVDKALAQPAGRVSGRRPAHARHKP